MRSSVHTLTRPRTQGFTRVLPRSGQRKRIPACQGVCRLDSFSSSTVHIKGEVCGLPGVAVRFEPSVPPVPTCTPLLNDDRLNDE